MTPTEHAAQGRAILERLWAEVEESDLENETPSPLDAAIDRIFDGSEVGYKKAIVIQLAGKAADPSLDVLSLQKGSEKEATWDAREFAKKAFNPWNASIGSPLGQAADPNVGNQFRNPRFDETIREQRRKKASFDDTLAILRAGDSTDGQTAIDTLRKVLMGLRRYSQGKTFDYPVPHRASLEDVLSCMGAYLARLSGGARLQALSHALMKSVSEAGFELTDLSTHHVNSSDASSKAPGDVAFTSRGRKFAVEVKDRLLTESEVLSSVSKARVSDVTELLFVVHSVNSNVFASPQDEDAIGQIMRREFASGLNIYTECFLVFSRSVLALIGEVGRRDFLKLVGSSLEEQRADASHRWEWSKTVSSM